MIKLFKQHKPFTILTLFIFLIFPLPFNGTCLMELGYDCPSWTFFGGLGYSISFFDLIISAIFNNSTSLLLDAIKLLPYLLGAFVLSIISVQVFYRIIKK